jgi:hypothetical protein
MTGSVKYVHPQLSNWILKANSPLITGGGLNVKNQNIEGSENQKFFWDDQNVESQKDHTSKDHNIERSQH